jgi:polyisoprenoid-binding protein YceI
MKKILLASLLSITLVSSLCAYELNGDLGVKWTGFKTEKKLPVSGTFNSIKLEIKSSDNLSDFLKSSNVLIQTNSIESKNPERNNNMTSTLFALASAEVIEGNISDVNEDEKTLILNVTMNEVTNPVRMDYIIENGNIVASGGIDILDFSMQNSYMAFAKKCAVLHENKSFSDVDIEFTIPYK